MSDPRPNPDLIAKNAFLLTVGGVIAWVVSVAIYVLR